MTEALALKVTQEKLPASQVSLDIEVPGKLSQSTYDRVLNNFLRKAAIPGFRKGKVPQKILLQQIGLPRIKFAALEELIDTSMKEAIAQEEIKFLGNVSLESDFETLLETFEPGQDFTFRIKLDVWPDISPDPANYTDLTASYHPTLYDPAQVDQVLLHQQKERATLIPIEDRPVTSEDIALIDLFAVDQETNEPFEGVNSTDLELDLSNDVVLSEFKVHVIGMSIGETKQVDFTFPPDFYDQNLVDREAILTITLKEIKERELPLLDDAFAQDCSEYDTLAELRERVEEQLQEKAEKETKSAQKNAIISALIEKIDFDVPEVLIKRETHQRIEQLLNNFERLGNKRLTSLPEDLRKSLEESLRDTAIHSVKQELLLQAIAEKEDIKADPEKVNEQVELALKTLGKRAASREQIQAVMEDELRKAVVLDWLLEKNHLEISDETEEDGLESSSEAAQVELEPEVIDTTATTVEDVPAAPTIEAATTALVVEPDAPDKAIAGEKPKKRPAKKATPSPSAE